MYKLFIADDEAIIREGLRCLLDWETLGFTIAGEAANGDAALQFLLSETPDLVLLDIRMPGMSGLDVVRIAREHGYDGKVVILSGYSDFNYARTAIRYGVLSYLTKPIDEDELLEIVTQIRNQLDSDASARDSSAHYRQKAYDSIIRDLLAGTAAYDRLDRAKQRDKVFITKLPLFSIRFPVMFICRHSFDVHISGIPFIGAGGHTVKSPVQKDSKLFPQKPVRHRRPRKRRPVRSITPLCNLLLQQL